MPSGSPGVAARFALLLPLTAVLWMAVVSKTYGQFSVGRADFRFWLHDAMAVAASAWAAGLLLRRVPGGGGLGRVQVALFFLAAGIAVWFSLTEVSWMIVQRGMLVVSGVGFLLAMQLIEGQARCGQGITAMLSAGLAASAAFASSDHGLSPFNVGCRGWYAVGFAVGALPGFFPQSPGVKPTMAVSRSILAGYLFAAGVALAPLAWAGDFHSGADALIFCGIAPAAKNLAAFAWRPVGEMHSDGQEREQRIAGRWLPVSLVGGIGLSLVMEWENLAAWAPLSVAVAAACGLLLVGHFLRSRLSPAIRFWWAEISLFTPLLVLLP